jgi:hypothetical protein
VSTTAVAPSYRLVRNVDSIPSMKLLAAALLLSVAATACVDDRPVVYGTVSLTGGVSPCADEDGDQAHSTISVYTPAHELVLDDDIACTDGSFAVPLDPGTYTITISSVTQDPVFGLYWPEDSESFDLVIDASSVDLGTIRLSID